MRKPTRAIAIGAAVAGALALSPATPAFASVYDCVDAGEWGPGCYANVTAINSGSYLAWHNQPNYSGGQVTNSPHFQNGDAMFLGCWTWGSGDADGHGDHYWFWTTIGSAGGYINDWYVTSGSYSNWSRYIGHC
jgi:hypothetical protein